MTDLMLRAIVSGGIAVAGLIGASTANIFAGKKEAKKYGALTKKEMKQEAAAAAQQPAPQNPSPVPQATPQQQAQVIQPVQFQQATQQIPATQTASQQQVPVQPQQFLGYDAAGNPVYGFQVAPAPQA